MSLVGKPFWARKQGADLAEEFKLRAKRYFEACERMNLIQRWRAQYQMYYMRDPYGKSGLSQDSSMLTLGTRQKPEIAIQVPEMRALLRQQLAFLLAEPVSFQVVASTGAQRNVMSSEVGEKALNYVYDQRCRPSIREFAECVNVYGIGATHLRWNSRGGDKVKSKTPAIDPNTQQPLLYPQAQLDPASGQWSPHPQAGQPIMHEEMVKSGAPYVDVCDPTMMAMDPKIGIKAGWIIGFEHTNLYVLAGQFPELADQILAQSCKDEFEQYRLGPGTWTETYGADDGDIIVMHGYYADRPELDGGLYALVVGDLVVTPPNEPCPLQDDRLPIRPLVPAKFTDNALGFADAFMLGPVEESLCRIRSSELNNYAYYGKQTRYRAENQRVVPSDDGHTRELVGPPNASPPQMLAIQPMPSGAETLKKDLLDALPRLSGFSDVSRGTRVEQTTSGAHAQVFEAITARNLSLPQNDMVMHQQELANDMLSMLQTFGNTAFIAEIAGPDGESLAREFSPQDLSTLRRLVAKAVPEAMRGSMARVQLVEVTSGIEDKSERAKAVQMILRGDDEYGRNDTRALNLIAIENERLISGSTDVRAGITQNHVAHIVDHQAAHDQVMSQENPDGNAIMRLQDHMAEHAQMLQDADPVMCKALGYPDPPTLPGNAAFVFAQRMAQAQAMLAPQETPDPVTGMVPATNPGVNDVQAQQQSGKQNPAEESAESGAQQNKTEEQAEA